MNVKIKVVEGGKLPERKTSGAVGFDCYARLESPVTLAAGERTRIPLGFRIQMPKHLGCHVTPRSGMTSKGKDTHHGTIDWDYTGEVCATLENNTGETITVSNGERIAQIEFIEVPKIHFITDEFEDTERGDDGFGSTGI